MGGGDTGHCGSMQYYTCNDFIQTERYLPNSQGTMWLWPVTDMNKNN